LKVSAKSNTSSQLDCTLFEKRSKAVKCRLRVRLASSGSLFREGEFSV
jgi:hypothetical protein